MNLSTILLWCLLFSMHYGVSQGFLPSSGKKGLHSSLYSTVMEQSSGSSTTTTTGTSSLSPGSAENAVFQCDPSIDFWRTFPTNKSNEDNLRRLQEILSKNVLARNKGADGRSTAIQRAYWVSHVLRTGYFTMNAALSSILATEWQNQRDDNSNTFRASNLVSGGAATRLLLETMHVYEQDYKRIQAGILKYPWDAAIRVDPNKKKNKNGRPSTTSRLAWNPHKQLNPLFALQETLRTARESMAIMSRRNQGTSEGVWVENPQRDLYPEYYLNDFHYQTSGWMSSASANQYEASTEMLFLGRQDAMQRQTLVPTVPHFVKATPASILEVGAGTGRFATFTRDLYPSASMTVTDLSPFYLEKARENDDYWRSFRGVHAMEEATGQKGEPLPARFVQANAESLPFADESFDLVTCVYLFHELPEDARRKAASEMVRVVKPGGMVVLTDSLQAGDRPALDASLGNFERLNEPHYKNYIACQLHELFEGLECDKKYMASNTKTLSFIKPKQQAYSQ